MDALRDDWTGALLPAGKAAVYRVVEIQLTHVLPGFGVVDLLDEQVHIAGPPA